MKKLIRRWLGLNTLSTGDVSAPTRHSEPSIRIGIIPAMNGRALEIGKKVPDKHGGYDW